MVSQLSPSLQENIIYPSSDGQPMADNTKQFELIVLIKKNCDLLFANNPDVFVAGDLLWYPVKDDNVTRRAPDIMVVFGRPKGDRGSYVQSKENNIPPQIVFEILSPGNTHKEMIAKYKFYERYGVEEYYLYDPDTPELTGWLRANNELQEIEQIAGWVSPRLGIRFELPNNELQIFRPDGQPFLNFLELDQLKEQEHQRAEQEHQRAEQERQRAEQERQRAEQERQRAEKAEAELAALRTLLQQKGINPEQQ